MFMTHRTKCLSGQFWSNLHEKIPPHHRGRRLLLEGANRLGLATRNYAETISILDSGICVVADVDSRSLGHRDIPRITNDCSCCKIVRNLARV